MKAIAKEKDVTDEVMNDLKDADLKGTYTNTIAINSIKPNKFNCNVMSKEDYRALKNDMKNSDSQGMSPIIVREIEDGYEIIDGEHRWKAAKELKWKMIGAIIFEKDSLTKEKALVLNFRINRQRGTHDPFKEATFFKHLTEDNGLTQGKVAKLLNIDRSTVNKRLSILKLDRKILKGVPHGTPPPTSVLEVAAQAPTKGDQKELIDDYLNYNSSIQDLEREVKRMKGDHEKAEEFKKDKEKFKFPNCPKCKKPAVEYSWDKKNVKCENWHQWSPRTGKDPYARISTSSTAVQKPEKKTQRTFRTKHDKKEMVTAVRKTLKKALNAFVDQVDYVELRTGGPYSYGGKRITFINHGRTLSLELPTDQGLLHVIMEPKEYKDGNKLKVQVMDPCPTLKQGPKKGQDLFEKMMKGLVTYGKKKKKVK